MAQKASAVSQTAVIKQVEAHNANVSTAAQAAGIFQGVVNAKNNAADIQALRPHLRVLHTICGLTWTQCVYVSTDGYEDFMDFENMKWDGIELPHIEWGLKIMD